VDETGRSAVLSSALHARLRPLRPEQREVLMRAAAIGREFDEDVLAELAGTAPARIRAALRAASRLQLVAAVDGFPGRFQFRHALTRDAVYDALVASELRPLHREIGTALERLAARRRRDLDQLAYHWWAAGDAERGTRYNEEAGDRARALHANEHALMHYRRAADVAPAHSAARRRLQRKIVALEGMR
jgi:adenylate cyclase